MKQIILRSTLLAAAVGFSSLAFAAPDAQTTGTSTPPAASGQMQHGMQHGMRHGMQQHRQGDRDELSKLNLTAAQRTNIDAMMRQDRAEVQPQMQELMQKRMAFENATPGSADYQTATEQLAQAEAQAVQARVTTQATLRTKIYNELTAQQRTEWASLRTERQARMQKWRSERAASKAAKPAPAAASPAQR